MSADKFSIGFVVYEVLPAADATVAGNWISNGKWDDGCAAFSKGDVRWGENAAQITGCLENNSKSSIKDTEGYLMEVSLWRNGGNRLFEEISIEREDRGFFCQRWMLSVNKPEGDGHFECYWRHTNAQPIRQGRLFNNGDLSAIEVIVPGSRLHFFLTTRGRK